MVTSFTFNGMLFLFELITFTWIYFLLNKYHHYEFQRNKNNLTLQFFFATIYHLVCVTENFAPQSGFFSIILFESLSLLFILKFVTIILVKSHIDILQGICKLDHLLKISIFQIYKNKLIQRRKILIHNQEVDILSDPYGGFVNQNTLSSE